MYTDVYIVSEPFVGLVWDAANWFIDRSGRVAIGVMNRDLTVVEVDLSDGYVAARIDPIDVLICYSSPS